jgi:hypothetical protein
MQNIHHGISRKNFYVLRHSVVQAKRRLKIMSARKLMVAQNLTISRDLPADDENKKVVYQTQ